MTVHPRRAREIARTRQDILEAAARAFAQNGYQAVTMQEIAREAGYTAASLYSYFSSKEEILEGLKELVLSESLRIFEQPMPGGIPLREKLYILLDRQLEIAKRRRELAALFHLGTAAQANFCEMHERRIEAFTEFLRHHASPEELGGFPPEELALMVTGLGGAYFMRWLVEGDDVVLEKLAAALDVLLAGLRSSR